MKNLKTFLMIGAALLASGLSASANLYTDTNTYNLDMSEGQSFTGQWSYGPIGAGETVTGVETWFKFSSTDAQTEQVHIDLGVGDGVTDKAFTSGSFNFGSNYTINWVFNSGSILADAANGLLSFTVTATNDHQLFNLNDFTFNSARVDVTTTGARHVPDGGATIALLGLGLVGMAAAQRKFRLVR